MIWLLKYLILVSFFIVSVFISQTIVASETSEKISVKSDLVRFSKDEGVFSFEGNVKLTNSNYSINANNILVFFNNEKMDKILATGNPLTIDITSAKKNDILHCEGESIHFKVNENVIYFIGASKLEKDDDSYSTSPGSCIAYDLKTEKVTSCEPRWHYYFPNH